jgi:hypothetical protein
MKYFEVFCFRACNLWQNSLSLYLSHTHTLPNQVADAESWAVINRIPLEPYTNRTSQGFTTRWLTQEVTVPFRLSTE